MPINKLTKAEIVDAIFEKVQVKKSQVLKILDMFFEELKTGLGKGRSAELRGLGTFEVRYRKGKKARNPKTGETVILEDHAVVFFKPGVELQKVAWILKKEPPEALPDRET